MKVFGGCSTDNYSMSCKVNQVGSFVHDSKCRGNPELSSYTSSLQIRRGDGSFESLEYSLCVFGTINSLSGFIIQNEKTIANCDTFDANKKKF